MRMISEDCQLDSASDGLVSTGGISVIFSRVSRSRRAICLQRSIIVFTPDNLELQPTFAVQHPSPSFLHKMCYQ